MNQQEDSGPHAPLIIPRPEHPISRADISESALKVLYRLHNAGYQAFLVGGAVRDLLLGKHPKDFDIATDAAPEDVRRLFRNCRLIGRRFRLAHVHFGREVIEVATFRASHDEADPGLKHTDDSGRIIRDNVYGSLEQDVWRRDFTANALYYNIADFSIWDYTGGVEDVGARVMRMIGDPPTRYREDPVRMLRAVRFAAKLDFTVHRESETPLTAMGDLLLNVPPARLFDEVIKLFLSGHAVATWRLLNEYDLFRFIFPSAARAYMDPDADQARKMLSDAMVNTDNRVAEGKPVTIMFLLAVFLWEPVRRGAEQLMEEGQRMRQALFVACDDVMRAQQKHVTIPRRIMYPIRDMMVMQDRFHARGGRQPARLMQHPRFRAAYDLLLLRAGSGEEDPELAQWWTDIQETAPQSNSDASQPQRKRRRRRPRNRARSNREQ